MMRNQDKPDPFTHSEYYDRERMTKAIETLRKECDIRADDNMKLCKEIDALAATIEAVRDYSEYRKDNSPCCRDILKLLRRSSLK